MKKLISLLLTAVILTVFLSIPLTALGASVTKSCVNLLGVQSNVSGRGYSWDNYDKVLTLDNINIKTTDEYGMKILDGATVVLKGKNYIEASKAAIFLEAKVIFKGKGSLTLVGKENGIYCSSADSTDSLSIIEGTYKITSGKEGIISAFHKVAISGAKITVNTEGGTAIKAQTITTGAKTVLQANGSLVGKNGIKLEASTITVTSDSAALVSDKPVVFSKLTLKAGENENSLASIDLSSSAYSGEKCIKTASTFDGGKKSLVFGDSVPVFVDVLLLIGVIAVLGCAVVIPVVYKKKKALLAVAKRDAELYPKKAEPKNKK